MERERERERQGKRERERDRERERLFRSSVYFTPNKMMKISR